MKAVVAGGRKFQFRAIDVVRLAAIVRKFKVTEIVSGGAKGADKEGEEFADLRDIPVKVFPADWRRLKFAAGPMRNRKMANYADLLVAFPGDAGTSNMVNIAKKKGLIVFDLRDTDGFNRVK